MKKVLIALIYLFVAVSYVDAYEQSAPTLISRGKDWEKFRKTFGKEKIKLKFPTTPSMSTEGGIVVYTSFDKNGASYTLISVPVANYNDFREDSSDFFLGFLSMFNNTSFEVKTFDMYKQDGLGIVDVVIKWTDNHEVLHGRIVTTKYNVFLMGTLQEEFGKHDHEYYVDSFSLER